MNKVISKYVNIVTPILYPTWKNVKCVFVMSTGRTGTDSLSHLFALNSKVDSYHEPKPLLLIERKQARFEIEREQKKYEEIFIHARSRSLIWARMRNQLYFESSPRLTFFAPAIADILPEAKFIHIHRHPAEVVRSGMRRSWYMDHPADYARIEPISGEKGYDDWPNWSAFQKICWLWDSVNSFSIEARSRIGTGRVMSIPFSEVFNGDRIKEMYIFMGIEPPDTESVENVLARKYNSQKDNEFPTYDNWSLQMRQQLMEIAGNTMNVLGYA